MKHIMRSDRHERFNHVCSLDDVGICNETDKKWKDNRLVTAESQAMQILGKYMRMFGHGRAFDLKPACIRDLLESSILNPRYSLASYLKINYKESILFGIKRIGETKDTMYNHLT